jgi:hypothetical protein
MSGWLGRVLLFCSLLISSPALAGPTAQLTLCVERPRREQAFAALLEQWLPVRLALARRELCPGGVRTAYCGWFEQRGAAVEFVLSGAGGERRREIPWLRRRRHPLSTLEARGRLAAFSVVLHALVAEHRLRWLLDDPPERAPASNGSPVEEQVIREPGRRWRRPGLLAATLGALEAPHRSLPAAPTSRAPEVQQDTRLASVGAAPTAPPEARRGDPVALAAHAPAPRAEPAHDEPGADKPVAPRLRSLPRRVVEVRVAVEPAAAAHAALAPRRPIDLGPLVADLSLGAELAGRWRSSGLLSWEALGCLGWRRLFLRAGYQPAAQWDLSGRPVQVSAVPLAVGWRPWLWRRPRFRLSLETAALVERFGLRRLDVPDSDHTHWDAGLGAGLGLGLRLFRALDLTLGLSGFWFPDAQEITIRGGPTARLTRLGARLALSFSWGGEGSIPRAGDIRGGESGTATARGKTR